MQKPKLIRINCDGSCLKPGTKDATGGWAVVITAPGFPHKIKSGHIPRNRTFPLTAYQMELIAVIEGLKAVKCRDWDFILYSDCQPG